METDWNVYSFEKAPVQIIDGDRGKNYPKQADFFDSGYCLFLNASNVTATGFNFKTCSFITHEKDRALRKGKLSREDVVLTTRGTVGNVAYYDQNIPFDHVRINSGMVILRADRERTLPRYLYLFLRSTLFKNQVLALTTGSAQPQLPIRDINRIKIPIPPISEQKAITAVLGAFDDKIQLNRQMIETLEAMVRAIFKSWFVDFDPVHAKARGEQPYGMDAETADLFPDSFEEVNGRLIPAGWQLGKLGDVADINKSSLQRDYPYQTIEYIDISSVSEGKLSGTTTYELVEAPSRARRLVKHGDVIWSTVRPNLKSYLYIDSPVENLVVSTGFAVISPKAIPAEYLYAWVTTDKFVNYLVKNASGSAYPAVRADRFADAPIVIPSQSVLQRFEDMIKPMRAKIAHNGRESQTLAELRDTLLPKLISGEVRVPYSEVL